MRAQQPDSWQTAGPAQTIRKPVSRLAKPVPALTDQIAAKEVAGKLQPIGDITPDPLSAGEDERRQAQQLAAVRLGLGGAHRAARSGADGNQLVVRAADGATIEVQAE